MITHLYLSRAEVAEAVHAYLKLKDFAIVRAPSVAHITKTMGQGSHDKQFIQIVIDEGKEHG